MKKLSVKQEAFVQGIAKGLDYGEAYKAAKYTGKGPDRSGWALAKIPKIEARIEELAVQSSKDCRWTKKRGMDFLCDIMENEVDKTSDKLKAFDSLSKMCGWNEAEQVEHSVGGDIVALLRVGRA